MLKITKKVVAVGVLAALMSVSYGAVSTPTVFADGMAYRERGESGNYSGLTKNQADAVKHLEDAGKYDKADRMRRYYREKNGNSSNDDTNGMDAFNRTHGRGNDDGSDGMAWRERQDNNNGVKHDRRPRVARNNNGDGDGMAGRERNDGNGDGMAGREQQDENGMDAFNRTHGR